MSAMSCFTTPETGLTGPWGLKLTMAKGKGGLGEWTHTYEIDKQNPLPLRGYVI